MAHGTRHTCAVREFWPLLHQWRIAHGASRTFWRHRARKKEWSTIIHYLFHRTLLHRSRMAHGASRTGLAHVCEEWLGSFSRTRARAKGEYFCRIMYFPISRVISSFCFPKMEDLKDTLITAVQAFPCLWDQDERNQVWEKIAKDYDFPKGKFLIYLICSMKTNKSHYISGVQSLFLS